MAFDSEIYSYVSRELQIPFLRTAGRFAAGLELGDQLASFCILFIMAAYFWQKPRLAKTFVGGLFALAAGGIVVQILKYLIGRARPAMDFGDFYFIGPHLSPGFDSFPSGHTTALFALLGFFCRTYPGWSVPLYGAGFLLSFLARVVTGQHFFTDVIGGVIVGTIVGKFVASRFHHVIEPPRPSISPAVPDTGSPHEQTKTGESDLYAGGRFDVLKQILVVVAFSAVTLLIGSGLEFSSRPLSAFFGILTCVVTYFLARELCGKETAVYAALILPSSFLFVNVSRLLPADAAWLFFTTLAFLAYVYSAKGHPGPNLLLVMSYASLGLGFLAKGPLALFPVLIFLLYEYLRERPSFTWFIVRDGLRHGLLLTLTLLVFALWLGAEMIDHQRPAAALFFDEVAARTGLTRHAGKVIYYPPLLVLALFPWTFFAIAYFVKEGKRWLRETAIDPNSMLLLLWATVVFGLFPFVAAKFPHYMILALPPLSCLLGRFISRELPESPAALRFSLSATLIVAACPASASVIVYLVRSQYSSLEFAAPFAVLTFFVAAAWLLKNRRSAVFAAICLGALGFYVSAALIAL